MAAAEPVGWNRIRDLDQYCHGLYQAHSELARDLAGLVIAPRLPNKFSENLVARLAPRLWGLDVCGLVGGGGDVTLHSPTWAKDKRAEVKATGASAFQSLTKKDLSADYLVWVHFNRRYLDGRGAAEIHVLPEPGRWFAKPQKVKLVDFLAVSRSCPEMHSYSLQVGNGHLHPIYQPD